MCLWSIFMRPLWKQSTVGPRILCMKPQPCGRATGIILVRGWHAFGMPSGSADAIKRHMQPMTLPEYSIFFSNKELCFLNSFRIFQGNGAQTIHTNCRVNDRNGMDNDQEVHLDLPCTQCIWIFFIGP